MSDAVSAFRWREDVTRAETMFHVRRDPCGGYVIATVAVTGVLTITDTSDYSASTSYRCGGEYLDAVDVFRAYVDAEADARRRAEAGTTRLAPMRRRWIVDAGTGCPTPVRLDARRGAGGTRRYRDAADGTWYERAYLYRSRDAAQRAARTLARCAG